MGKIDSLQIELNDVSQELYEAQLKFKVCKVVLCIYTFTIIIVICIFNW